MTISLEMSTFWIIGAALVYKLIDWLIRRPKLESLAGRYVLITGSDHGFGYMLAKRLDDRGLSVIAACLTEKGETELKKHSSNRLQTVRLDVTKHESVLQAYEKVTTLLPKGTGLWSVVNNAGIFLNVGPPEWLEIKDYMQLISVNLLGVIDVATTFLPLVKQAKGRIVTMSSIAGRFAITAFSDYNVSKFGVEAFSDGLRRQLRGTGVSVHLLEPGFHMTPLLTGIDEAVVYEKMLQRWPEKDKSVRQLSEERVKKYARAGANMVLKYGRDPVYVVDAYEHAITASFPRPRYLVGPEAKALAIINDYLPEWMGDQVAAWLNLSQSLNLD